MKVFIDILTPKQCMLFGKLSQKLTKKGHEIFQSTREYREVVQLLRLKGTDAKVVGKHGGGNLFSKLRESAKRTLQLATAIKEWNPDVVVSFSSPEATRAAFGLGIPHVCINDSPHAEAVARLTIPLSKKLLTSKMIPIGAWTKFGISKDSIVQYDALDAWAWLKDFKPDEKILADLGLDETKPILTFRTEETFAAYLLHRAQKIPVVASTIQKLLQASEGVQVVVISRYEEQTDVLKNIFHKKAVICQTAVDAPSLLSFTSIFVGAGGTMTSEAALLGVPTFSCYPEESYLIEKYLLSKGLAIRETNPRKLVKRILETLDNLETVRKKQSERARRLTSTFEDPVDIMVKTIEGVCT
jgi:predicted glycosyltransferase